jgi:hypothetical protein
MSTEIVYLLPRCPHAPSSPEQVCIPYAEAKALKAFRGARVLIELKGPGHKYQFELEDVCVHGRLSPTGHCWCIPVAKAIKLAAL